jgi:hypothetical protein
VEQAVAVDVGDVDVPPENSVEHGQVLENNQGSESGS